MKMLSALASILLLAGCSQQKTLVNRLKNADRVVVTNTMQNIGISVTDADVSKAVQAIADGKKESSLVQAAPGFRLEFYKGSERLAGVDSSGGVFWIGKTPYSDDTETFAQLYQRMRIETALKNPEQPR